MSTPTLKQETVDSIDEEELSCSDYMYPSEPLESSQYVNYYDSKGFVVEKLKKEFTEHEYPQSDFNIHYTIVSENKKLLKLIDTHGINHENTEDGLSFIKNEEIDNKNYQGIVKIERLEEPDILDNAEVTSVHYDVLVTLQEIQCKLCGRKFKNSFNLLKHNNEHIKVEINTRADNELHQCQYCDNCFNSHDNMLAHVDIVHNKKIPKFKLCEKQCKSTLNVKRNVVPLHKQISPNQVSQYSVKCWCGKQFQTPGHLSVHKSRQHDEDDIMKDTNNDKIQCEYCQKKFKNKQTLITHVQNIHYDYGKVFDCWCGKQFRSPTYLRRHKRQQHNNETKVQCDYCQGHFKNKQTLIIHVQNKHYDYGKVFECWCGKQFRSPVYLRHHKSRQHINEMKVQCDYCQKKFKHKFYLLNHIKTIHYEYGKVFACWCGKQFLIPARLSRHKRLQHGGKITRYYRKYGKVQSETSEKKFKNKQNLITHKQNVHYDSGKVFECRCGKQFRSPMYLRNHKRLQHNNEMTVECDYCQKKFKHKYYLSNHIKLIHYDYGKVFACWCGKQFRTPLHLGGHKRLQHGGIK